MRVRLIDEPQPRLVHERRGLQRMVRPLAGHPRRGEGAQFAVDKRQQRLDGLAVAAVDPLKQTRDFSRQLVHGLTRNRVEKIAAWSGSFHRLIKEAGCARESKMVLRQEPTYHTGATGSRPGMPEEERKT